MRAAFIFAGLRTLGIAWVLFLIVICAFSAWRIRRNMVFVLYSLTVILVCSGFLTIDSWDHANSSMAALGAVLFVVALVVLGIAIRRLLGGIGKRPTRILRRNG
jgi:hypothetical protein